MHDNTENDDANQPPEDTDQEETKERKRQRGLSPKAKLGLVIGAVIAVVALLAWFIHYEVSGKYMQETDDAEVRADSVTVAPKVNGYVDQVLVADNQDVKAGQPLVRIDARDYNAQADQALAQIAEAQASADAARAGVAEQLASIEQGRAQLASARIKARHDADEAARHAPLAQSGAESRQQADELRATAAQSAENMRAQAAALAAQERHVAGLEAQVRQSEAQARAGRAQLSTAHVNIGATMLRAVVDGRIGDKTVTVGQYVQAGSRLLSVVPIDKLYVVANFKETQLGLMRPGQAATISVDALQGMELTGRVSSLAPGTGAQFSLLPPENATGNFTKIVQRVPVRIEIQATPDARRLIVPGMSVTVTVDTRNARDELARIKERQKQHREQTR